MDRFFPFHPDWKDNSEGVPSKLTELIPKLDWLEDIQVFSQTLPFYPSLEFRLFHHPLWEPSNLFIYTLSTLDNTMWLNGTSPPIHELNEAGHLHLTEDTALDYLRFFCFFVRGEEGPFYVVTDHDSSYLPTTFRTDIDETALRLKERFHERFQSPRYFGKSEEGSFRYSALIYYSNAMFVGDFEIQKSGNIEMFKDSPVLADLPVKLDAPVTPPTED